MKGEQDVLSLKGFMFSECLKCAELQSYTCYANRSQLSTQRSGFESHARTTFDPRVASFTISQKKAQLHFIQKPKQGIHSVKMSIVKRPIFSIVYVNEFNKSMSMSMKIGAFFHSADI